MERTVAPGFPKERFRQSERIHPIYFRTIQRFRNRIICHFRRPKRKEDGRIQTGQIPTDKFYIRIRCPIPIDRIIAAIERRESNDTFL